MRVLQIFRSAADGRVISELDVGRGNPPTSIPVVGDEVHWFAGDNAYSGKVTSRTISYSRADKIALDRANEVDVRAELTVELIK